MGDLFVLRVYGADTVSFSVSYEIKYHREPLSQSYRKSGDLPLTRAYGALTICFRTGT
jgi:hypothetical protein